MQWQRSLLAVYVSYLNLLVVYADQFTHLAFLRFVINPPISAPGVTLNMARPHQAYGVITISPPYCHLKSASKKNSGV
jgi:hypothetical protein